MVARRTVFLTAAAVALAGLLGSCVVTGHPGKGREPFDLQAFVDRELAAGAKRIVVPPGRYRVTPRNGQHLVLSGLDGVELVADGVEMICTGTTRALTVWKCRNLAVRGLTIDYDPLPYTQGLITAVSPNGMVHDIELFEGYPPAAEVVEFKYEVFRGDTRTLRFGEYYGFTVERPNPRHLRVRKADNDRDRHGEQVGDIAVIGTSHSFTSDIPHAVYCEQSAGVTFEGITLYASNCFGFLEVGCDGNTYKKCVVDRRPVETDIRKRGDARVRSLNADAFHSKHASVGPRYVGCTARFQGDDCVAISGEYHMVMDSGGRFLRVLSKWDELTISPGDPVELVSYSGARLPNARVVSIADDGKANRRENAFIERQYLDAGLKSRKGRSLTRAYRIEVDRAVSLPMGSLICSTNRVGNGFSVVDCELGFNRSRGILVKASHGEIRGNRLEGVWMDAIIASPEYWWLEAGSGNDLSITGNTVRNCLARGITVAAYGGKGEIAPAGAHNSIVISGNSVEESPAPCIRVTSTKGLLLEGNILKPTAASGTMLDPVELVNCEDVTRRQP